MARRLSIIAAMMVMVISQAMAQTAPSPAEEAAYKGLHAAAAKGDGAEVRRLLTFGAKLEGPGPGRADALACGGVQIP